MDPKEKITINDLRATSINKRYKYYDELAKSYAKFIKEIRKLFGIEEENTKK